MPSNQGYMRPLPIAFFALLFCLFYFPSVDSSSATLVLGRKLTSSSRIIQHEEKAGPAAAVADGKGARI